VHKFGILKHGLGKARMIGENIGMATVVSLASMLASQVLEQPPPVVETILRQAAFEDPCDPNIT